MHDKTVSDLLEDMANEVPARLEIPADLVTRTRRRFLRNVSAAAGAAVIILAAGGFIVGSLGTSGGDLRPGATSGAETATPPPPSGRIVMVGFDGRDSDIFVLDVASGAIDQMTDNEVLEANPAWAPHGGVLAYERYKGVHASSGDAIVVHEDGGKVTEVADASMSDTHPDWAPDGRHIAFATADGDIYVVGADGSNLRRISEGGFPAWSPDGSRLAFIKGDFVYTIGVADGQPDRVEGSEGAGDVDWSPDGTLLAFSTYDGSTGDVYTIPPTGGSADPVVISDAPERDPSWSPDGHWIAAVRVVGARARIVVLPARGEGEAMLLTPEGRDYVEPHWGPAEQ